MDKKLVAVSVIAIVALVVAIVSLAFALTVISINQPNSSTSTPTATSNPTIYTPPTTSSPSPTPVTITEPFNPTITISPLTANSTDSPLSYVNSTTVMPNGTYRFTVNLTNPASSAPSPNRCYIQFVLTEVNLNSASASDVSLGINTQGRDLYNAPTVMYSFYTPLNATVNGNTLTYLCAPAGDYWQPYIEYLSPNGFTVTTGFNETFSMKLDINTSAQYRLAVNIVPAH